MITLKYKWREWLEAAAIRAIRTMAETAISVIGMSTMISEVDWKVVIGSCALSGLLTMLLAIKGLPEVSQ